MTKIVDAKTHHLVLFMQDDWTPVADDISYGHDIELSWLAGVSTIGVTAGASAPPAIVQDIISARGGLGNVGVTERVITTENIRFSLPKEVRQS